MAHSYDAVINAVVLPPRVEKLLKIERHHDSMAEKKKETRNQPSRSSLVRENGGGRRG